MPSSHRLGHAQHCACSHVSTDGRTDGLLDSWQHICSQRDPPKAHLRSSTGRKTAVRKGKEVERERKMSFTLVNKTKATQMILKRATTSSLQTR